jgi:hypothetical protein
MLTVARMLDLSLASSITPNLEAVRVAEIEALANPVKRLGAEALHSLAINHPERAHQLMTRVLQPHGIDYVGFGVEASVYRTGDNVIKVHRKSTDMNEAQRQQIAQDKEAQFNHISPFLGNFLLTQTIAVDTHPLGKNLRAVQTTQPYFEFVHNLGLFTMNSPQVSVDLIDKVCRQYPGIDDELRDFVAASNKAADATQLLPDVNGRDNLVISTDGTSTSRLMLIDSQPIVPQNPGWVQDLVRAQLGSLSNSLREIA